MEPNPHTPRRTKRKLSPKHIPSLIGLRVTVQKYGSCRGMANHTWPTFSSFSKGPQPLLWVGSHVARVKNHNSYTYLHKLQFNFYTVYIKLWNVAAGLTTAPGGQHVIMAWLLAFHSSLRPEDNFLFLWLGQVTLSCIWKVPSLNLGSYQRFLWIFPVPPDKYRETQT
jgi:hypothetical protein